MKTFWAVIPFAILALLPALFPSPADAALPKPNQIVTISGVALERPLSASQTNAIEVAGTILSGWHINSDRPLNHDYIATRLTLKLPAGITLQSIQYPPAEELKTSFSGGEKIAVFTGSIRIKAIVSAAPDFKAASRLPVALTLEYQACNDNQCLQPTSIGTTTDLISPAQAIRAVDETESQASSDDNRGMQSWLSGIFETRGYLLGFLLVLLGGLALNLTPCVYPLIGVTIAYFGRQGGGARRVAKLASLYVVGIALMFSTLGLAAALSGGLFGAALEKPLVLATIAAMLMVLAASSFGWFQFRLPQWMLRSTAIARPGYLGAVVMGLGMGVVAAPCIGPFVLGLLLLVERSGNPLFGFSLFFTLALGMGLPYVGLAMAAGSIRKLPRSGEWLAWVEQLFGFVLVGMALYFLEPLVPNRLITRALPFYVVGVGAFLGFVSPAGRAWPPFRLFKLGVGSLSILALIQLMLPQPPSVGLVFLPFDNTLLASAETRRAPVVIDFSADWCIPCREMEKTTFADPAVVNEASRFLAMRADLTRQDEKSEALRSRFKVDGVPTALFIDSHGQVKKRLVGYAGVGEFLDTLRQIN